MMKYIYIAIAGLLLAFSGCSDANNMIKAAEDTLHGQIMDNAVWALEQEPVTVTASSCERSEGGTHDFYSEGDYWWPNPKDPDGPYIRRDGESNPDNFSDHRHAMMRLSKIVGYLASAYVVTGDEKYAEAAFRHIDAWFVNPTTMMNPNLQYAQAIKGVTPGRGVGIIDTIHLMEVAQGIIRMETASCVDKVGLKTIKQWFDTYLVWLSTSKNGIDELNAKNNHTTCWIMQAASFAKLTGNRKMLDFCTHRYKNILLPAQMATDGSFPLEINRTKPYGYSLFNLDAMATICQILSTETDNLWEYSTDQGLSAANGIAFMYPYIKDKASWPHPVDVMYWDEWPVAQPALLFAAIAYGNVTWFELWTQLNHTIAEGEVERNVPIRNPIIWI